MNTTAEMAPIKVTETPVAFTGGIRSWMFEAPEFRFTIPQTKDVLKQLEIEFPAKASKDELIGLLPKKYVKENKTHSSLFEENIQREAERIACALEGVSDHDFAAKSEMDEVSKARELRRAEIIGAAGFNSRTHISLSSGGGFEIHLRGESTPASPGFPEIVTVPDTAAMQISRLRRQKVGEPILQSKIHTAAAYANRLGATSVRVLSVYPGLPIVAWDFSGGEFEELVSRFGDTVRTLAAKVYETREIIKNL